MASTKTKRKKTNNKKKLSGVRGQAERRQEKQTDLRGITGIIIFCVGILGLACQFLPNNGVVLGFGMRLIRGIGGRLCLLLPLMLCWAGISLVFFREHRIATRTLICSLVIFMLIETMIQLFMTETIIQSAENGGLGGYFSYLASTYQDASLSIRGGGILGGIIAWPLYQALDVVGGSIVIIFAVIIVLMIMTGISFGDFGIHFSEWTDDFRESVSNWKEERDERRRQKEEERLKQEEERAIRHQKQKEEDQEQAVNDFDMPEHPDWNSKADEVSLKEEDIREKKNKNKEAIIEDPLPEVKAEKNTTGTLPFKEDKPIRNHVPLTTVSHRPIPSKEHTLYIEQEDFERRSIDKESMDSNRGFTEKEAEDAFLHGMDIHIQSLETEDRESEEKPKYAAPGYTGPQERTNPLRSDSAFNNDEIKSGEATIHNGKTETAKLENDQMYSSEPILNKNSEAEKESVVQNPISFGTTGDLSAQETEEQRQTAASLNDQEGVNHGRRLRRRPIMTSVVESAAAHSENDFHSEPENDNTPKDAEEPMVIHIPLEDIPGSVPSSIPAKMGGGVKPAPQENRTIVQLRENRIDGTPVVIPVKDRHDEIVEKTVQEYQFPPLDLLNEGRTSQDPNQKEKDEEGQRKLLETLESFGVQAKPLGFTHGPAITRYEIQPAPGVKVSRIVNLVDDIALNMASDGVRIEAPIPGKAAVGIEVPNQKISMVSLREVLETPEMRKEKSPTAVALGKGISGVPVIADMAKMPHVLIAGATGSGKSVCINTIINSIIFRASPDDVRLILVDPKVVELSVYNGIPHLLVPVVTDPKKASAALDWAVVEMEHRYKRFESMGVRDIRGYNAAIQPGETKMYKIIVIIDELADLMMVAPGGVEESICRLAQLARAAGIHLVIATQRPSVNVITGVIKANIPSRIAFAVSSQIDSRTILDASGAEKLLGKGDMLYAPQGAGKPTRVQGCFVSDEEVQRIVEFVKNKHSSDYNEEVMEQMENAAEPEKQQESSNNSHQEQVDEMLNKAIELALDAGQVSISMLQRRLRIGYARAGRLVDDMTLMGIVGEAEGPSKPRQVVITREEWKRRQENENLPAE